MLRAFQMYRSVVNRIGMAVLPFQLAEPSDSAAYSY